MRVTGECTVTYIGNTTTSRAKNKNLLILPKFGGRTSKTSNFCSNFTVLTVQIFMNLLLSSLFSLLKNQRRRSVEIRERCALSAQVRLNISPIDFDTFFEIFKNSNPCSLRFQILYNSHLRESTVLSCSGSRNVTQIYYILTKQFSTRHSVRSNREVTAGKMSKTFANMNCLSVSKTADIFTCSKSCEIDSA